MAVVLVGQFSCYTTLGDVTSGAPWGSKTQIRSCGESVVFEYEATEQVATADSY
jgi:hypothetical protein